MKFHLFGCKDTTLHISKFFKDLGYEIYLITIDPDNAERNDVAGYIDLSKHADLFSDIYIAKSYSLKNNQDIDYFSSSKEFELGFCIGWQRLIPSHVLQKFVKGIHGMHGSARDLPFGKGRSPMNWSIIEDRKFFFTNLFKYQDGIDDGPIIDRITFSIKDGDTAETLHYKNMLSMCSILENNLDKIIKGEIPYQEQKIDEKSTFYPKRSPIDGLIDWRDDIENIARLVRAVSKPFSGAITYLDKKILKIYRSEIFYTDLESHPYHDKKFGQVCDIFPSNKFIVRCSGGVLLIHEYEGVDLNKDDIFDRSESPFRNFRRNVYGFFDTEEDV